MKRNEKQKNLQLTAYPAPGGTPPEGGGGLRREAGQSLIEAIIAMAIFALMAAAMVSLTVGSYAGLLRSGNQSQAESLANEAIEALKSVRETGWNTVTSSPGVVAMSGSHWSFSSGLSEFINSKFTRTITFDNVCRDASDNIAVCPAAYTDIHSKKATVTVLWAETGTVTNTVQRVAYISNWDSSDWTQTDWSGGTGQAIWSDATKYDSDDGNIVTSTAGQVSLVSDNIQDNGFDGVTDQSNDWPFTIADNYMYDTDDIELTGGFAQLVSSGGTYSSGTTTNEAFTSDSSGWTFFMWDANPGEVDPSGAWQGSGGNPTGYVYVDIPSNSKNDELGGYWEQSISITEDDAVVTCSFDWKITNWIAGDGVDDYQFYVFLDSNSSTPTIGNEIWSSGTQSGITDWSGQQNIDCSLVASTTDTYYYKIAVWLDAENADTGPIIAGFDNAKVEWEKTSGGSYPTDKPYIYPKTSFTAAGLASWASFIETATKNGGEIYYQLSDNDGVSWKYWNGSAWIAAGASNYNTASIVNANISNFSSANEKILFKAFLESDGSQLVRLSNVQIIASAPAAVWSFSDWDFDVGEEIPTGNTQTTGGSPDGYADITVQSGNNDEVGGFWEQAFTTFADNPSTVTIDFDYKVIDYNGEPDVSDIRIFVDTLSGIPSTQVGSSINVSSEGTWTTAGQIDISSAVASSGTYYLKMAFWAETGVGGGSGPFTIGFDNVNIELGNAEYPLSGQLTSSAYDMEDASPVQVLEWDENTGGCGSCDVQLQIRTAPDSGGFPGVWTNWYGASGAGTYFINPLGALVPTILNGKQWAQYRAKLSGDGASTPVLQEVRVNYK